MKKYLFIYLLTFFVCCSFSIFPSIKIENLPLANKNDIIDIFSLQASFMKEKVGDLLYHLNLIHGAVGLKIRRPNGKYKQSNFLVIDFNPNSSMNITLVPKFTKDDKIIWDNKGAINVYNFTIPDNYWNKKILIGSINGKGFNKFRRWFINYAKKIYDKYYLLEIYSNWDVKESKRVLEMSSFECHDFAYEIFKRMKLFGATFKRKTELDMIPKRTFVNLYVKSSPIEVSFDDPEHRSNILSFFKTIFIDWKDLTYSQIMLNLYNIKNGNVYIFRDDKYYLLKLKHPYFGVEYEEEKYIQK